MSQIITRPCQCDFDPDYHRDLNVRRGKQREGARCTNVVSPHDMGWNGSPRYCTACLFGCCP